MRKEEPFDDVLVESAEDLREVEIELKEEGLIMCVVVVPAIGPVLIPTDIEGGGTEVATVSTILLSPLPLVPLSPVWVDDSVEAKDVRLPIPLT
jgi:hypothetical protein